MAYRQLSTEERYQIAAMRARGMTPPAMALELGRHRSTVSREVKRNATPYDGAYRPSGAVEMTNGRRGRSRRNAPYGPTHVAPIEAPLQRRWSPAEIVGPRRLEGLPGISHETIYLWLWADKAEGSQL